MKKSDALRRAYEESARVIDRIQELAQVVGPNVFAVDVKDLHREANSAQINALLKAADAAHTALGHLLEEARP